MRETCGLLERTWTQQVEVSGADRVRFLNGLITCQIAGLEPGDGAYGFMTSLKGRILADLTVLTLADRLWLEVPKLALGPVLEHCRKYLIIDQVEFLPRPELVALTLIGPRAAEVLSELASLPAAGRRHLAASLYGLEVRVVRQPELGVPSWTVWTESAAAPELFAALSRGASLARPIGHRAFDRFRVEQGWPLFGRDYDAQNFPQETGLDAVSYTKGCYLGQEVVARIHYRGGVNRRICGLRLETGLEEGASVLYDGREAGRLSSLVETPEGALGLAMLHKRAAEPGTRVELEGGGAAEVIVLPLTG